MLFAEPYPNAEILARIERVKADFAAANPVRKARSERRAGPRAWRRPARPAVLRPA